MDASRLKELLWELEGTSTGARADVSFTDASSLSEFKEGYAPRYGREPAPRTGEGGFVMRAVIGGYQGSSCWGGEAERYHDPDGARARFTILEAFCEKHLPHISLLAFRRMTELIEEGEVSVPEYYGNSTDYRVAFISLERLAEFIEREGLSVPTPDGGLTA